MERTHVRCHEIPGAGVRRTGEGGVSTNLLDWTPFALRLNTNGTVLFADPASTNASREFYRAVMP